MYLEFTVTFSLFYLFDSKFLDQMGFFYMAKYACPKDRARVRGFARPERVQLASGAQFVQNCQ